MEPRLGQPETAAEMLDLGRVETGEYSGLDPVPEEDTKTHQSTFTSDLYQKPYIEQNGCQREPVTVRKRDSFNSKARPVSTGSVDSYKSGLHSQGSVKRKDARPPSIAEDEGNSATISQEAAESSNSSHPRFQRRQLTSTAKPQPTNSKKDNSPESSLSSYDADITFPYPSKSVTCSFECDSRISALEESMSMVERRLRTIEENFHMNLSRTQSMADADVDQRSHSDCELETNLGVKFITDREQTSKVIMSVDVRATKSVHSTPFFSDHNDTHTGYQMCIQMNVHKSKKGEIHLSFSLVIMRGKHDDCLPWPFNREIILACKSAKNSEKCLTFKVEPKSDKSFERPKSDLNKPIDFMTAKIYHELLGEGFINEDKIVFFVTVI